jgi:hypothetical protein
VGGRICSSTHLNSENNILIHIRFSVAMFLKLFNFGLYRTCMNPNIILSLWKSTVVVFMELYICVCRSNWTSNSVRKHKLRIACSHFIIDRVTSYLQLFFVDYLRHCQYLKLYIRGIQLDKLRELHFKRQLRQKLCLNKLFFLCYGFLLLLNQLR